MNLEISEANNFFRIEGILDKTTVGIFKSQFQDVFEYLSNVTISIEDVVKIDKYGVSALAHLHNESITRKKRLSIVGSGYNDLYHYFKSEEH